MTIFGIRSPRGDRRARSDAQGSGPARRRGIQIGPRIRVGGSVGKAGQNVKKAVGKAVKDTGKQLVRTGHQAGAVLDNKWTKAALAAGLAATGVGAPLAAGIMATSGAAGAAMKKGGNLGKALKAGGKGALMGAGAGLAGGALRNFQDMAGEGIGRIGSAGAKQLGKRMALNAGKSAGQKLLTGGSVGDALKAGAVGGVTSAVSPALSKLPGATTVMNAADKVKSLPGGGLVTEAVSNRARSMGLNPANQIGEVGPDGAYVPKVSPGLVLTNGDEDMGGGQQPSGGGGFWGSLMGNAKAEAGRVGRRVLSGQSPISTGGGGGEPGGMSFLDKVLMGGTIAAGTADTLDSRRRMQQAEKFAVDPYNARAGLRKRALSMLADESVPDYSALTADPGNPYDRQRRMLPAGGA